MESTRFVFLFAPLISVSMLPHSNPVPSPNRPDELPIAAESLPGAPAELSQMRQDASFEESQAKASKATLPWREALAVAQGVNFEDAVQYRTGPGWHIQIRAAVADVNGGGKPDLLVANKCADESDHWDCNGLMAVLLGNGDGTFQTAVTYDSGGWLVDSVTVADVNGDGKPDLLVANLCYPAPSHCYNGRNGLIGVLLGNGDGTFQTE
jgi:hypothetical protein